MEPVSQPIQRVKVLIHDRLLAVTDCVRLMRDSDVSHDIVIGNPGAIDAVYVLLSPDSPVHTELVTITPEEPKRGRK